MGLIEQKVEKEFQNTNLHFTITENNNDPEAIKKLTKALAKVGVYLDLYPEDLYISIIPRAYANATRRYAGPRKKFIRVTDESGKQKLITYADVIPLMQTLPEEAVYEMLRMAPATYYRHKKAMRETDYFKSLDPSRLDDAEYLHSQPGNFAF